MYIHLCITCASISSSTERQCREKIFTIKILDQRKPREYPSVTARIIILRQKQNASDDETFWTHTCITSFDKTIKLDLLELCRQKLIPMRDLYAEVS